MKALYHPRVLVVEDDPLWIQSMKEVTKAYETEITFDFARSSNEAVQKMASTRFHLVSIDQNIPKEIGGIVLPENGFELCERITLHQPLVDRRMYTAHGRVAFSGRAARLGNTEYFEKKTQEGQADALDIGEYVRQISSYFKTKYLNWLLRHGSRHLPPVLSAQAQLLEKALAEFDDNGAVWAVINLWDFALWITWAQACLLAVRVGEANAFTSLEVSDGFVSRRRVLESVLPRLAKKGSLFFWNKFISDSWTYEGAGDRFLRASSLLNQLRDRAAHKKTATIGIADVEANSSALLDTMDAVAFWSEYPFLVGIQNHPEFDGQRRATRIAGPPLWGPRDVDFDARPPSRELRDHVFVPHRGPDGAFFLDLYPLISMLESPGQQPQPILNTPRLRSGYRRHSLLDGAECDVPLSDSHKGAISEMFKGSWKL